VEIVPPEASNGWVYRAEAEPAPAPLSTPATQPEPERDPFQMIGEGVFLIGFGSARLMYRAASGLMMAPFRLFDRGSRPA
jgi:hypothetical protein